MLDLFTIFSKGGIVLWCFQSTSEIFTPSVNALIKNVILQVSHLKSKKKIAYTLSNLCLVWYVLSEEYFYIFLCCLQEM